MAMKEREHHHGTMKTAEDGEGEWLSLIQDPVSPLYLTKGIGQHLGLKQTLHPQSITEAAVHDGAAVLRRIFDDSE